MKALISYFFLFSILFFYNPNINDYSSNESFSINSTQQWIPGIAKTKNNYGQNYSISIRIQGTKSSGQCRISSVQASNGSSWSTVRINRVIGENCNYSFSYGQRVYYFKF